MADAYLKLSVLFLILLVLGLLCVFGEAEVDRHLTHVLKITYETNLRRLTIRKNEILSESFKFDRLENRIRELFQLPAAASLAVTYTDEENDVITIGNNQDFKNALLKQARKPLRIHVTLSKSKGVDNAAEWDNAEVICKRLLRTLSSTPENVGETLKHAIQVYAPFFEGVKCSAQIPSLVEIVFPKLPHKSPFYSPTLF